VARVADLSSTFACGTWRKRRVEGVVAALAVEGSERSSYLGSGQP
jgi:hypothetical protein